MLEQPSFEIVQLTPDDWQIYRELRLAALTQDAFAFGATFEREQRLEEADLRARLERRAMFAARVNGDFIGLVGGVPSDEEHTADLISMWVAPEVRRRSIGHALVRAVLEWAGEQGFDHVKLWVTEGNQPAERLYARNGFVPTGEREHIRPNDPDNWEIEMVYEIEEPSPGVQNRPEGTRLWGTKPIQG
jgi:ribosomal protein S18 acetylase RimI-like enzyme